MAVTTINTYAVFNDLGLLNGLSLSALKLLWVNLLLLALFLAFRLRRRLLVWLCIFLLFKSETGLCHQYSLSRLALFIGYFISSLCLTDAEHVFHSHKGVQLGNCRFKRLLVLFVIQKEFFDARSVEHFDDLVKESELVLFPCVAHQPLTHNVVFNHKNDPGLKFFVQCHLVTGAQHTSLSHANQLFNNLVQGVCKRLQVKVERVDVLPVFSFENPKLLSNVERFIFQLTVAR